MIRVVNVFDARLMLHNVAEKMMTLVTPSRLYEFDGSLEAAKYYFTPNYNSPEKDGKMKKSTLGGRIDSARTAQGLTSSQLASRLGVLTKTIRNWQSDRSEPRTNKLVTLAGVLNVSVMWLMTGTDPDVEKEIDNSYETASLSSKMERLLSLHQQASVMILEIQGEVNQLQNQIDMGEMAITVT